ncbi:MAG TPA: hypothetical protein VGE07_25080 [Herpetosiphonaceae bacterium]
MIPAAATEPIWHAAAEPAPLPEAPSFDWGASLPADEPADWPGEAAPAAPGPDWLSESAAAPPAPEDNSAPHPDDQPVGFGGADAWQTLEAVGAWDAAEAAEPEPPVTEPEPSIEPQPWAPPAPLAAAELAEMAATCAGCDAQVYGNAAFCWRCHAAVHCCATCAFAAEPTCKELQQISGLTARNRCPWWRPPG